MHRWPCLFLPAAVFLLGGVVTAAQQIHWYCQPKRANVTSTGEAMGADFVFELGIFRDHFIPSLDNLGEWESHWAGAARTPYNPDTKAFDSNFVVLGNASPFVAGTAAWIWGRGKGAGDREEWILFRKNNWDWPNAHTGLPGFPLNWSAFVADTVVVGEMSSAGMRTDPVGPPSLLSYPEWVELALAGRGETAPTEDPDGDGFPNLLEFALGTDPLVADARLPVRLLMVELSGRKYLQLRVEHPGSRAVKFVIEVSGDLMEWKSGPPHTQTITGSEGVLEERDRTPVGEGATGRFMRLRVELP